LVRWFFMNTMAKKLEAEEPAWVRCMTDDIFAKMDHYNDQNAAHIQNIYCISDEYPIFPVPVIKTSDQVDTGAVPPGTPICFPSSISFHPILSNHLSVFLFFLCFLLQDLINFLTIIRISQHTWRTEIYGCC
jgi:hypothetical protein